ncbi:sigma-70 family RNA polymerase sigma factor [Clostridium sp. CF011]|uniref:RNA polymerase sigma factor n=1 Tax=unclassified Clostridium TaxID=2614128 RepID=UPI001C0C0154|nr:MULTISPECIES: sigma factor-like helix-turn-helix DNA-binding protein [unclassified Clostridium]MBU3091646.1 sigma-70 family RNA polymerase sigma factor [Clostridium sp. CF011]MBW9145276.1 sigma-70 family RNA polymerase sigma factor [Clostridium sp. CM027]UVE40405.1 sigma-70 family RNA polymerase sigma factor [Clostridium sp. CM027]WAG69359.1 sigma-70 family RNA polymerase sigma factor [Clostridium sp. CF011]
MVIKYEFVTGEIAEIEVSKDIAEIAIEIGRETYNNERRETRRHNSLEKKKERGFQFEDKSVAVDIIVEKKETSKALHNALEKLLPQQKVLVQKMFFQDISITQIARAEGVNEAAIRNRLKKIYKKLKNI